MNFWIETKHPVAADSIDHQFPHGTAQDDSRNPEFNRRLADLMTERYEPEYIPSILDLGCAGGGMVLDFHQMGWLSVGVEGSDYSKHTNRAAWAEIPDRLFTADITKPFYVHGEINIPCVPHIFDVVTAWEVLEHIAVADLRRFLLNVYNHMRKSGLFICSVANYSYVHEGHEYHATVKPFEWWEGYFTASGFVRRTDLEDRFNPDAWVRHSNNQVNEYGAGSRCFIFSLQVIEDTAP